MYFYIMRFYFIIVPGERSAITYHSRLSEDETLRTLFLCLCVGQLIINCNFVEGIIIFIYLDREDSSLPTRFTRSLTNYYCTDIVKFLKFINFARIVQLNLYRLKLKYEQKRDVVISRIYVRLVL